MADVQVRCMVKYFEFLNYWQGAGVFQLIVGIIFVYYVEVTDFSRKWIPGYFIYSKI